LLPAQRAVRITPNAAIGSVVINSKATERRFKIALGTTGGVLLAAVVTLFFFASSENTDTSTTPVTSKVPTVQTTGSKLRDMKNDSKPTEKAPSKSTATTIDKLMEQGLVQTYPGDPLHKQSTFHVDRLIQTPPASLDLPTLKYERYVTVPVILHEKGESDIGYAVYRPNTFTLQDAKGHSYEPIDYVNHNEKAWVNAFQYYPPYRSQVDLVYRVPDKKATYVLLADGAAVGKKITVKIAL